MYREAERLEAAQRGDQTASVRNGALDELPAAGSPETSRSAGRRRCPAALFRYAPGPTEPCFRSSEAGNAPSAGWVRGWRYQAGHGPGGVSDGTSDGAAWETRCEEVTR